MAQQRPDLIDTAVPWCLTDDHQQWRAVVREFAETTVRPTAAQRSIEHRYDPELSARMGALGLFGLLLPADHGGAAGDLASLCIALEELTRVDSSASVTVHVQTVNAALIARLAPAELAAELLPAMATGEAFVSLGLTEPSGGTDAGNVSTRATRTDGGWIINGAKQFISNSGTPTSRYIVTAAVTSEPDAPRKRVSIFLVPTDSPGLDIGKQYDKLGWRGADTHPIFYSDVFVPDTAMLGAEGEGYRELLKFLTWARIPVAAMAVGLAQGCLEATHSFVTNRTSFGRPLQEHQSIAFGVAELAAMTHAARSVTYDACWKYDHGVDYAQEAAICKLLAAEIANKVAYKATGLHGGYGFMDDYDVTRHYRDARILAIGEGTAEVQLMLIARSLGLS
jgi:short-chain 2-methylacyl-CoA dehydrogenase